MGPIQIQEGTLTIRTIPQTLCRRGEFTSMKLKISPGIAKKGKYKGEHTLVTGPKGHGKYPVTKGGKVHCGRVRSAKSYGVQHGSLTILQKAGLSKWAAMCGFKT